MRSPTRIWIAGAVLAWLVSAAWASVAPAQGLVELALPRPAANDETVWIEIRAGSLEGGREIAVSTDDGLAVGTVSPSGVPRGQGATYSIPLPRAAVRDGRVRLRLEVLEPGAPPRAPRAGEVESVTPIYVPFTRSR